MRTQRGFRVYAELTDSYGNRVRVQESSAVEPRVWIFCENDMLKDPHPHLTPEQAAVVLGALAQFCADNKTLCQAEGTNQDETGLR